MEAPADIRRIADELDAAEQDARALVAGLDDAAGRAQPAPGSWSVAECLDHLATANRVYIRAMEPAARFARQRGRTRRGPAQPGLIGGWFVRVLEPPVRPRFRARAPRTIQPRSSPPLQDAFEQFIASQHDVRAFLNTVADLELRSIRFVNPFVPLVRFSLATGLHVILAHERRHLLQGWNARRAVEGQARA